MINSISKNYKIKVVVTLLAIFIWFFVKTENNYKYSFEVPIQISNLSQGKIITNDIPKFIKVTFWGKGRELISILLSHKIQYNIDLINVDNSIVIIPQIKNIRLPGKSNIEVLNILEPDSIYFKIEDLKSELVPIYPDIDINLADGYTIVNGIQMRTDSILIIGPKNYVDSVSYIKTEKLIYNDVKYDINRNVKLIKPVVDFIQFPKNNIFFFVDVQKLMEKNLSEIPITVINAPNGYNISVVPSSLKLTLVGGVDMLLPITKKDIVAYIDYNKSHELAYIEKIENVRFQDIKPKHFKIVAKKIR